MMEKFLALRTKQAQDEASQLARENEAREKEAREKEAEGPSKDAFQLSTQWM
jgi:hypothetical protein